MELSAEAIRVLACLMEKERTVPDTYPMTLKSLLSACNQSTNRFPVVAYDSILAQRVLDDLKANGFVRFVHPSHGERTTKYRQVLDEKLGLEPDEAAVLCVLALRGPQTLVEIRTRTERLHAFASLDDVESTLERLAARDEPLVVDLGRRPGEREGRWTHLLAGEAAVERPTTTPTVPSAFAPAAAPVDDGLADRVAALEAKVARLYELLGEEPAEEP